MICAHFNYCAWQWATIRKRGRNCVNISADAIADERIGLVYAARIKLNEPYIGKGNFRRPLTSGMNATA